MTSPAQTGAKFAVIFSATLKGDDPEYVATAERLRALAETMPGFVDFESVQSGSREITLSYWKSEADIRAWREHPEHRAAQAQGRQRWYEHFSVQVVAIQRAYQGP